MPGEATGALPVCYAEAAVMAYRWLPGDKSLAYRNPKVASGGGSFDLTDGDPFQLI
jgi:hypothetical protein